MAQRQSARRSGSVVAAIGLIVASLVTGLEVSTAEAVGPTPPTLEVLKSGVAATNVTVDDVVTMRTSTPVDDQGLVNVEMTAQWSSTTSAISGASAVSAPQGWIKTYTSDGTNYVASPGSWSNVIGVKAVGTVNSSGFTPPDPTYPLGLQNMTVAAAGDVRPTLASFVGSSAGDGWNVFHGLGNVYNFYHHGGDGNWTTGIDCHNRITSASCWTGKPNTSSGALILTYGQYISPARSWGYVDEIKERAWGFFKRGSDSSVGFLCFDVSVAGPGLCSGVGSSGFVTLSTTAVGSWEGLGDMEFFDGKLWARTHDANSPILCMVVSSATPCTNQPYAPADGYSAPGGDRTTHRNRIFQGKMYFTSGNSQFDCFDLAGSSLSRCPGSWPVTTSALPAGYNFRYPIFAVTSGNGSTITKVCVHHNYGSDRNSCFTTSGAATSPVANLPTTGGYSDQGWGDNFNYKDRYYFNNGGDQYSCWDFTANAGVGGACSGYTPATLGNSVYMVSADPVDENCLWSNGHSGKIQPFNALTGALNCAPVGPTVDLKASTFVPRLPCSASGAVRQWTSVTVFPPDVSVATGVTPGNAKLTVLVGGVSALSSWTNVAASSSTATSATFDLSGLSVSDSGLSPTFAVSWVAGGIAGTTGEIHFRSDPAQLCVDLTVDSPCPSGNGQSPTAGLPGVDHVVLATSKVGSAAAVPLTTTTTATDNNTCLGSVSGSLSSGGQPLGNATVTLMPANASPIRVTTSAQGVYTIPRLFPGPYPLIFPIINGQGPDPIPGTVAILRNDLVVKDGTYDADALRAPDITRTVLINNGAVFTVSVSAGAGVFDPTRTRLVSPVTGAAVSTITLSGEPSWSLDNDGNPEASGVGTAGTYFAIYQVETSGGSVAQGLLTLIVTNPTPSTTTSVVTTTTQTPNSTTTHSPSTVPSQGPYIPPSTASALSTTTPVISQPLAPPTSRAPAVPVTVTLAPGAAGSLPQVPAGQSLVIENGTPVQATVQKIADSTWQMTGRGFQWQMQIPALGEQPGSDRGVVTLVTDRDVEISGFGFKGESLVDLWLFSSPVFIGTVRVDAKGNFVDELKVPSNITPGFHTLQANGLTPDDVVRTLNLGVQVLRPKPRLPVTGSSSFSLLEIAVWLVVGGTAVYAIRRRRYRL